jgi:Family of unknown function (DUF5996)
LPGPGAFHDELGEFFLNYADLQDSADPAASVLEFLDATYSACADAAGWDRAALDRGGTPALSSVGP